MPKLGNYFFFFLSWYRNLLQMTQQFLIEETLHKQEVGMNLQPSISNRKIAVQQQNKRQLNLREFFTQGPSTKEVHRFSPIFDPYPPHVCNCLYFKYVPLPKKDVCKLETQTGRSPQKKDQKLINYPWQYSFRDKMLRIVLCIFLDSNQSQNVFEIKPPLQLYKLGHRMKMGRIVIS